MQTVRGRQHPCSETKGLVPPALRHTTRTDYSALATMTALACMTVDCCADHPWHAPCNLFHVASIVLPHGAEDGTAPVCQIQCQCLVLLLSCLLCLPWEHALAEGETHGLASQ